MVGFSCITTVALFQMSAVEGRRVHADSNTARTPCAPMEWSLSVIPNVHHNEETPWKRDEEGEYRFNLPEATAGWFRAAIHEAPCPSFARHPDGKATFNCEASGEWRMTKETCSHSSSDCFARTVHVATADGYGNGFPFQSGDDGAHVHRPCDLGPWNEGELDFICTEGDWELNGEITCSQTHVVEEDILDCPAQAGYGVTLQGEPADYTLPRGDFGERTRQPCAFASRSQGEIEFLCQESGSWAAVSQLCSAPSAPPAEEAGCNARVKNLAIGGIRQRFPIHAGSMGSTVEVQCTGDLEGTASFHCRERGGRARWSLSHHTCAAAR